MTLHPNQDKIVAILGAAEPNANLMAKAQQNYDIQAQMSREQRLYEAVVDPITGATISNIQQLNNLIRKLDMDESYGFGTLLPNAAGGVEEELSKKYNLRLIESNRFSETEQTAIKDYIEKNLVSPTLDLLNAHGFDYVRANENEILSAIIAGMGVININNGNFHIFSSTGEFRSARNKYFGMNVSGPITPGGEPVGTIRFMYNILKNKDGSIKINLTTEESGEVKDFKIDGDLNKLTDATRRALMDWANGNGLLDASRTSKAPLNPGGGTKAPGSATPEEWKTDVYNAVNKCLGSRYKQLMQLESSEVNSLFNKYQIGTEIALGRQLVNLRGFLGELRGILMIDAICPSAAGRLTGTAKVDLATKMSRKGQSAPTDLLVQLIDGLNLGIQIKNTSEMESYAWGNYRSSKGMPVPSFYAERLQSDITAAERNFFGAYVYNQPINDSSYQDVYGAFQGVFELFYWVYSKLALYIIRQETEIANSSDNIFNGTLKNDFFIMNNSIVPTSALYKAMNDESDLIESEFNFETGSSGYYSYTNPIPDNYMDYASQLLIHYQIELHYAKLLRSAYNMI